jgi:hypothetical protein
LQGTKVFRAHGGNSGIEEIRRLDWPLDARHLVRTFSDLPAAVTWLNA